MLGIEYVMIQKKIEDFLVNLGEAELKIMLNKNRETQLFPGNMLR